jgi:hypothetical protein
MVSLLACAGAAQPTRAPEKTEVLPTRPVSGIDFFEDIKQPRRDAIRVADWEKHRDEELLGERVHWEGYVIHKVEESEKSGLVEIRVELDPRDTLLLKHFDAFFYLPPSEAAAIQTGQDIVLDGDIEEVKELGGSVDIVLTVHLANVILHE